MHIDFPNAKNKLSKGHMYDLKTNVFDNLDDIFLDTKPNDGHDYIQIYGLAQKKRSFKYIRRDYIENKTNLYDWKIFVPEANGSGSLEEVLSTPLIGKPLIGKPLIGNTQTFISIGKLKSQTEATAVLKYIKTKFTRVLLGILKITQHNPKATWAMVPMQDFTSNSDIDWTKSVQEIDLQLYKKYDLSQDEINFIETKVQAMD